MYPLGSTRMSTCNHPQVSTCESCGKAFHGSISMCSECFKMKVMDTFIDTDEAFDRVPDHAILYVLLDKAMQVYRVQNNC